MTTPTSIRPHDRVTPLASKMRLRASMRESSRRRTCPECKRGNALCRYSRMDDRWMLCRYCVVVVDGEAVRHE